MKVSNEDGIIRWGPFRGHSISLIRKADTTVREWEREKERGSILNIRPVRLELWGHHSYSSVFRLSMQ